MTYPTKKQKTAILNEGQDNTFIDVSSAGADIGIHDKGKGTIVISGKHEFEQPNTQKWWEKTWVQAIFLLGAIAGIISLLLFFR